MQTEGFSTTTQYNNFVPPEVIAAATQAVSNLGTAGFAVVNKDGLQGDVKAACGAKPILNIGGKKDAYLACANAYAKSVLSQQNYQAQQAAQLAQLQALQTPKGLSTPLIIGISATMLVLTGVTIYLAIKN